MNNSNTTKKEISVIKFLKWLIGAVLVGGLGSGVWEYILKPVTKSSSNIILNVITFGMTSLKNNIYISISKGFHEYDSLLLLVIYYTLFISFTIWLLTKYIQLLKEIKECDDVPNTQSLKRLRPWFIKVSIVSLVSFSIIYFTSSFKAVYVNDAITYYSQLKTICTPYVEVSDIQMFDSKFAQIQNGQDYYELITELENIAKKNNLKYNKLNIF